MDAKKIFFSILLFFIFGAFLGFFAGKSQGSASSVKVDSLQQENEKISAQIASIRGKYAPSIAMKVMIGKVENIESNSITITLEQSLSNILEGAPKTRKVIIDANTKITSQQRKTQQEFLSDVEKYKESVSQSADYSLIPPPSQFKEVPISLNDIHSGDSLIIDAGKDVKTLAEFSASKITLQPATNAQFNIENLNG